MVMYNYAFKFVSNGTKSFTLKYLVVKNFSADTPRDKNILTQTIFTSKYPMVNFSQITVLHFNCTCLGIMILEVNIQQSCSFLCKFLFTEMYVKWSVIMHINFLNPLYLLWHVLDNSYACLMYITLCRRCCSIMKFCSYNFDFN